MTLHDLDYVPVTGRGALTADVDGDDGDAPCALQVDSEIDLHIVKMLQLHGDLRVRFRNQDLTTLSVSDKQALIQDMNDALGIRPLVRRDR